MKFTAKIFLAAFLLITPILFAQTRIDIIKRQATLLMSEGRLKEAIDQLNKYIAANPREAEGYHIRGLCYEKTTEYQYSVLDLRRARRLDPNNPQIKKDLDRVIAIWHEMLYKKIEGHKRDIAIDPNNPFSYLEIGKSYRWLEEWNDAEIWYDEYLKRDDNASPDEIIRYTEILAKTGSITKGEKILKKYVDRYPNDWRLWSRYGYFTLWLAKYKIAEDAFLKALSFKPFFQEAQDGLDLVRNQAYLTLYQPRSFEKVYPIDRYYSVLEKKPDDDDTRFNLVNELINANRYDEAYQQLQFLQNKYSEDERFKTLSKTVNDFRDSTLNKKVAEYTDTLKNNPSNKEYVIKLAETYANLFYYDNAIEILEEYLNNVPEDQDLDARFKLAQYSAWNYEWEKAIAILNKLLEKDPDNLDYQLLRGQIGVWTVLDFDIAEKYLLNVVDKRPKNIDAYISLASMYSWKKNFPEARKYLDIAKSLAPNSPEIEGAENNYALHLSAYEEQKVFEIRQEAGKLAEAGNCAEAVTKFEEYKSKRTALTRDEMTEYASYASCAQDYAKSIAIYDTLLAQQFDYHLALYRARDYYNNGDTTAALSELLNLSKINPEDMQAHLYLADAYAATNQLDKAELIYRELRYRGATPEEKEVLEDYDYYSSDEFQDYLKSDQTVFDADSVITSDMKDNVEKRMVFLADSYLKNKNLPKAEELYNELQNTTKDDDIKKDLPIKKMYLGDAYSLQEDYGKAEDIYSELLDATTDTTEIRLLNQRMSWIPPSGLTKGIYSIGNTFLYLLPTNVGISPFSNSYKDNQDFSLWNYGMRLDAGFLGFLGLGASWSKYNLNTIYANRQLTAFKGVASLYFSKKLIVSGSYGTLNIPGEPNKKVGDATIRFEKPDVFSVVGYYENNDARLLLYAPTMIFTRLNSELYRLTTYYQHRNILRVSFYYSYYDISDGNYGNDFQFRLGKKFIENGMFGYEYFFSDFAFVSSYYYSPQNFDSHSIWGEYNYSPGKNLKTKFGGKIGYVPKADFIVNEIYGELNFMPIESLTLTARLSYSNSFRYDSSYQSFSALFSAYWNIY
jgi:tetratricopeptide (TPR) repeat protein